MLMSVGRNNVIVMTVRIRVFIDGNYEWYTIGVFTEQDMKDELVKYIEANYPDVTVSVDYDESDDLEFAIEGVNELIRNVKGYNQ